MKNKEIIEEMAKEIVDIKNYDIIKIDGVGYWLENKTSKLIAETLYDLGYRKLSEDSVVLTKEEYNDLKLQIQQAHNKGVSVGFDLTKYKENSIAQACKETAEQYKVAMMLCIQEMQKYLEITEEQAKILYHHNAEIAKQFEC